jgi:hypothetical protein
VLCGARGWQKTVLKTVRKVAALHATKAPVALAAAVIAAVQTKQSQPQWSQV